LIINIVKARVKNEINDDWWIFISNDLIIFYIEEEIAIQYDIDSNIDKFDSLKYHQNQIFEINIVSFIYIFNILSSC
jgi:hypothetical protein